MPYRPKDVLNALLKLGFVISRQKGSHCILTHRETGQIVPIPLHAKDLPTGTFHAILKQAGITEADLKRFL